MKKQSRKELRNFLKKLSIPHEKDYTSLLLDTSSRESYIETISNKADSLHCYLDKNYIEVINEEFYKTAGKFIKKERLSSVDIVADITTEDFYGKSSSLYIHPWTYEKGIKGKFHYLVAGILFRNKILPFYVEILPLGVFRAELLGNISNLCNKMHLKVRCMYMDRGFYSGDIINELELKDMNYLIFARKSSLFKHILESVNKDATIKHEIKYCKNKRLHKAETNIVLVKDVSGYDWCFATNLFLKDARKYIKLYRRRWNIETMFRVHDEARIKSKSIKAIVRFFYFTVSMLLVLLWNLYAKQDYSFKRFILMLEDIIKHIEDWRVN